MKHGMVARADYFLLAAPDKLYLWTESSDEPQFEKDAEPVLGRYFSEAQVDPSTIYHDAFELLVGSWLQDLSAGLDGSKGPSHSWLEESGLAPALKGGSVRFEAQE